jgi:hypothetical protein
VNNQSPDLAGNTTQLYYLSEEANVRQNRLRRETETQLQEVQTGAVRQGDHHLGFFNFWTSFASRL